MLKGSLIKIVCGNLLPNTAFSVSCELVLNLALAELIPLFSFTEYALAELIPLFSFTEYALAELIPLFSFTEYALAEMILFFLLQNTLLLN
jgi:hypothetical protein